MREEYTRENYPSFGKKYAGEKAIISLTSWKARIDTVSKTLYSLLKQCPGFHTVLVLSEEEFPKMMDELPENLNLFVKNNLIEVLWVYKNYKSFKKVLFTMDKYRDVPVISADDDCIYTCNYAQELYDSWRYNRTDIVLYRKNNKKHLQGPCVLYSPKIIRINSKLLENMNDFRKKSNSDDTFFTNFLLKAGSTFSFTENLNCPFIFHDEIAPLHPEYKKSKAFSECYRK